MNSRTLFWPAQAVEVMSNESDMPATCTTLWRLPIKNDNNLKINHAFIVDSLPNPLNSSVSLNHKQGTNLEASVNFQALGQSKRQGAKLRSR
jgi:hypothetical protein